MDLDPMFNFYYDATSMVTDEMNLRCESRESYFGKTGNDI